jgi:hypothetical protein
MVGRCRFYRGVAPRSVSAAIERHVRNAKGNATSALKLMEEADAEDRLPAARKGRSAAVVSHPLRPPSHARYRSTGAGLRRPTGPLMHRCAHVGVALGRRGVRCDASPGADLWARSSGTA